MLHAPGCRGSIGAGKRGGSCKAAYSPPTPGRAKPFFRSGVLSVRVCRSASPHGVCGGLEQAARKPSAAEYTRLARLVSSRA